MVENDKQEIFGSVCRASFSSTFQPTDNCTERVLFGNVQYVKLSIAARQTIQTTQTDDEGGETPNIRCVDVSSPNVHKHPCVLIYS